MTTSILEIRVATALSVSACSIVSVFLFRNVSSFLVFSCLLVVFLSLITQSYRAAKIVIVWGFAFCAPLFLIHGVLNSNFPVSGELLGGLSWRQEGLIFSMQISSKFFLVTMVASYLLSTSKDEFVDFLIRLNLPSWLILSCTQSFAISKVIERRVSNIYIAQKARGINVGPKLIDRIRAFSSIAIPSIVGTIIEADQRVPALVSRGFGTAKLVACAASIHSGRDWVASLAPMFLLFIIWWFG